MTSQLYVGNLSTDTTEATLRTAFERDGRTVRKVALVTYRRSGKSRGFAFVEMEDEEQAGAPNAAHNGSEIDGREIKVNIGKERPDYSPKGGARSSSSWESSGRGPRGRY